MTYQGAVYESVQFIPGADDVAMGTPRITLMRSALASLPPGAKVLDVGCADGSLLLPFSSHLQCAGVDVSKKLAGLARDGGLSVALADCEDGLPFASGSLDCVITGETIEHIPDTDYFLSEINRVLATDGLLVLSCPNVNALVSPLMMVFLDLPPQLSARYRSPHVKDFTAKTLRLAVGNNGFQVESLVGTEIYLPKAGGTLQRLARAIPRLAKELVVVARKRHPTPSVRGMVEQELNTSRR